MRKTFAVAGLLLCALLMLPAAMVASQSLSLAFLIASSVSLGLFTSNVWAITQTLAGPRAAGRWTGIENFVGNLGGAVAPVLTGFVLGRTGNYFWAFAITAVVSLLGALSWAFWIGPVEPVVWSSQIRARAVSS